MTETDQQGKQPRLVPYRDALRLVWGDDESGKLPDWFLASDEKMSVNIVAIPVGGAVLHSDKNRSIFGSDEFFYVLDGTMVQSNPTTGEVLVIESGDAAWFRKDTWHHQWNYSDTELRFVEFFHPSPKTGTGQPYAQTHENITAYKHKQDEYVGRWPMARAEAEAARTMWAARDADILWRLEGHKRGREVLTGIMLSTENVTIGKQRFLPGQRSDVFTHNGDKLFFVEEGTVHVEFPETRVFFELGPRDSCQIPEGTPHSFYNVAAKGARAVFCVAPDYLPATG
jgi:mannose-6-phosphate isomerase-like protein (cupin superfamily)